MIIILKKICNRTTSNATINDDIDPHGGEEDSSFEENGEPTGTEDTSETPRKSDCMFRFK